jgi:hypothetical protein
VLTIHLFGGEQAFEELNGTWNLRADPVQALQDAALHNPSGPSAQLLQQIQTVPAWVWLDLYHFLLFVAPFPCAVLHVFLVLPCVACALLRHSLTRSLHHVPRSGRL